MTPDRKRKIDLDRRRTDQVWDDRFSGAVGSAIISGSGSANQVAYWDSTVVLTGDAAFTLDTADDFYVIADGGGIRNNSSTVALILSANGSIQLDNAGNARGAESIDLQNTRIAATGVVSGDYSFAACSSNIVSGNYSAALGYYNEISGSYGLITGSENIVSANYAISFGETCNSSGTYSYTRGQSCQSSGTRASAEGTACVSDADYAWTTGRRAKAGGYAGVWIWADHTNADFSGIIADEFAIRARGGFRHAYSDTYYMSRVVAADGDTTFDITAAAGTPVFNFNKTVNVPDVVSSSTVTIPNTGLHLLDTNASHDLIIAPGSDITADRTFTITTGDADRALTLGSSVTLNQDLQTTDSPSFAGITINNTGLHLLDTGGDHDLIIAPGSDVSADRTLTITTGDSDRTITLSGDPTLSDWFDQNVKAAASPTFAGVTLGNTGLHLLDTNASHDLIIAPGSDITADRTLTLTTGDANRTITLSGNPTLSDWFDQAVKQASSPTFADVYTTDGGMFGISGNELLTVNAAGTFAFSGISGVTVEDADWIGNGATSARLVFNSAGATDYAYFMGCDVGVGAAPDATFFVKDGASGRAWSISGSAAAAFERNGVALVEIITPNTNYGSILFGDQDDEDVGEIRYVHSSDEMYFRVNAVTRARIGPNGYMSINKATYEAQLDIDQSSTTAGIPVLRIDQGDISEEAIYIVGESSAGTADQTFVDASDFTTPGALLGWVKMVFADQRVGGLGTIDVWVPGYAIPTA